jgi:uncharacterized RDD family membrane protein YckC
MEFAYASAWKRLGALLVDTVIVLLAGAILGVIIGSTAGPGAWDDPKFESRLNGMGYLLAWLYYAFMESSSSQGTLGKKWLGLHVVDLNAQRISFWRATGRFFGRIISVIPLCAGFFMAFFTQKRQTLHDMMAGCIVIDERADSIPSQHIDSRRQQVATPLSPVTQTSPAPAAPSPALTTLNGPPTSPSPQSHSLPSSQNITITTMSDHSPALDEDAIYAIIADEIESGKTDKGLWTRLYAELDGDEKKTKVAYIKQRIEKIMVSERARLEETQKAIQIMDAESKQLASTTGVSVELAREMLQLGVTKVGDKFAFNEYRYDQLTDALNYAKKHS